LDKKGTGDLISLIVLEEMGQAAPRKMPKTEVLNLV